jgi:hypothetical protein
LVVGYPWGGSVCNQLDLRKILIGERLSKRSINFHCSLVVCMKGKYHALSIYMSFGCNWIYCWCFTKFASLLIVVYMSKNWLVPLTIYHPAKVYKVLNPATCCKLRFIHLQLQFSSIKIGPSTAQSYSFDDDFVFFCIKVFFVLWYFQLHVAC